MKPIPLKLDQDGLLTCVVQDVHTMNVLMVAWMNEEAFERTRASGETWFWSRSRQTLWHKGATSGNTQKVVSMRVDCDNDTLLLQVEPNGPACHTGAPSCFFTPIEFTEVDHDAR